ncbi:S1 family peptidase [Rhodococcus tibetensis]|uniref:S1 family peptidase n=1 Tax=Rhodococcus tibetensis TaxID=2965064 RepID=A0ABT1QFE4_9NOCA|nr:S1 family peptidase [Rhodococcus sp. FXJ9.536]MCQ4120996.1 S1 family peptidase [Rhodococcus sp. FXJ9.536]
MRNVLAHRAAVVGASAMLLLFPFSTAAQADPVTQPDSTPQLSAEALPAELVEAITRDLKISPQEYLDRAAKAQELGSYAEDFRAEHPDGFAGAWIGLDGQPVVAVTTTEAAAKAAEAGYTTRIAPVSANGLEKTLSDVNGWIASLPKDVASQINSASIDVLENRVVIDVVNSPVGQALNLPTLLANVKVMLSPGGGGPVERGPLGGDTYITTVGELPKTPIAEISVCSLGFNGVDDSGQSYNISAGHCNPAEGQPSPVFLPNHQNVDDSQQIGAFSHSSVGNPADKLDYSLIKLNDAGVQAGLDRPAIRGANGTALQITGTARPVVGAPICKSGQTSSFTCGVVAAEHVETQLFMADGSNRVINGFAGTACTLAGDSGGAIVTGTLALGITSGSNASGAPNCTEANLVLAPEGGTANLGIPVADIVATAGSGLQVRTNAD